MQFAVVRSGTGKTFWLEGLGQLAVEAGLEVLAFSLEDLGILVRRHRADDSVTKAVTAILRAKLIVVADIGLLPVSPDAPEGFYRLVMPCTRSGRWRSVRKFIQRLLTSSCLKPWRPLPLIGSCITLT